MGRPEPLAKSWPTMRVDLEDLYQAVKEIQRRLPGGCARLADRDILRWHRMLQGALHLCEHHRLSDYRLQVSTYARLPSESDWYPSMHIEASGHDTTVWLGLAFPTDIHAAPLVARVFSGLEPRSQALVRWGGWLYVTEPPTVDPLKHGRLTL